MVNVINIGKIPLRLVCARFLFLSTTLNCGQAFSAVEAYKLYDLPLDQLVNVEVVSASRFKQKSSEAPSAGEVVTSEDIRSYGWRTLADALNSSMTKTT